MESSDGTAMEVLHEIKMEYTRFKDKILKELKKLQKDISDAIEEVTSVVGQLKPSKLFKASSLVVSLPAPN
jgi:signal transduction histidine kinase